MLRAPPAMMALWITLAAPAFGQASGDGTACRVAVRAAERAAGIPAQLLSAIARVESGRRDPATGQFAPWPWTINVEGQGFFFDTKAEAVAAVRRHQQAGARSIDVGCMQVNLLHHPTAFAGLEQAFDPATNAAYAARFLLELRGKTGGDWQRAAAFYHSQTPERADDYQRRVMAAWPEETRLAPDTTRAATAQAWLRGQPSAAPPPGWGWSGGAMLSNRVDQARTLPAAAGSAARALDAYRAAPIALASRAPPPRTPAPPRRF